MISAKGLGGVDETGAADAMGHAAFDRIEMQSLRHELLLRMAIQNSILLLLIPMFLATILLQIAFPAAAFLAALGYAIAAGMGALIWCHSGVRQAQIKAYLLLVEARHALDGGWESWLPAHRIGGLLGTRWFVSTKGVFMGSQLAAVASAWRLVPGPIAPLLAGLAALLLLTTAWFLLVNPKESLEPLALTPHKGR